jgi:hypothetical protein
MRFSYKEADMTSIWAAIRTSLVQKVSDVRKSNKRRSLGPGPEQGPGLSSGQDLSVVSLDNTSNENQLTSQG